MTGTEREIPSAGTRQAEGGVAVSDLSREEKVTHRWPGKGLAVPWEPGECGESRPGTRVAKGVRPEEGTAARWQP